MKRIAEKKEHTKALNSLSIMETRMLAIRKEHVTNLATPKGKLVIVLLVKEELAQVYFKTTHRLVRFHFGGREFQTDDPRMQNSSCIGQYECEVRHSYLTGIVQVLC